MQEELGVGLFSGVAEDIYHQLPGVSQSQLKYMSEWSPKHLKWKKDHPDDPEESDTLALGGAVHDAVLLPDVFDAQYMTAGPCEGVTGKGNQCSNAGKDRFGGHWFCGTHAPKDQERDGGVVLTAREYEVCMGIRGSVHTDPDASVLLNCERKELTAVWEDEATGLLCRGRFDCLSDDGTVITDLKTARSAKPELFNKAVYQYGYNLQAYHYLSGARALGLPAEVFACIPVEKVEPFCLCVGQVDDEAVEAGGKELRVLMRRFAECAESGHWPGYRSPTVFTLPAYAWKQIEERVDNAEVEE